MGAGQSLAERLRSSATVAGRDGPLRKVIFRSTSMTDHLDLPILDEARQRLVRRFGDGVGPWMDELPDRLLLLSERWNLEYDSVLPRGSMSVVLLCRTAQGQRAILKICPDLQRVAFEIAALTHWSTPHAPTVLQLDSSIGALLMEEIQPGTPLMDSGTFPALNDVAEVLAALHTPGPSGLDFPSLAHRVIYLFAAWERERRSDPMGVALVPQELFDRGRRLALWLAEEPSPTALLHGDFTPVNLLDGGEGRGLIAIDPCPTLGDPAFDAIDLILWQADDLDTISRRAQTLGRAMGLDPTRLLNWCIAFGGMTAADLGGTGQRAEPPGDRRSARVNVALILAARAP
jgi:streptomycin 6-kinase